MARAAVRSRRRHPWDALAQTWMLATSRRMPRGDVPWLLGPVPEPNGVGQIGHGWVERTAAAVGGHTSTGPEHGLLQSFSALAGPTFDPRDVDPRIADFYQQTSMWRLDLWSEWSPFAWPFGQLISALWSQRLQQLSLPMRPLDVSFGMDSSVVHIHAADGTVAASAWLRTMRKTGDTTYSGQYDIVTLPGSGQPSVRVTFPLTQGWLTVLLDPSTDSSGGIWLRSPIGTFGGNGAYLVLERDERSVSVRRIPIAESFHLYVDTDGDVRTDHSLRLFTIPAVRLHYRMQRDGQSAPGGDGADGDGADGDGGQGGQGGDDGH